MSPLAAGASNGVFGGPGKGELIMASARNTSGRTRAQVAAMGEPKSWPITASTWRRPWDASNPRMSRSRLSGRNGVSGPSYSASQPVVRP